MTTGARRAQILQAINELPPLNQVARHLISLIGNERTSATDLDRVIRNDQALTARVLKHANSSVYGKSRRIASLTDAVVLLGEGQLSDLVLGVSVSDAVGDNDIPGFQEAAWDHSIDCAAAARALARLGGSVDPDTAFVAGLMHDIGMLVLARAMPVEMAELLARDPEDPLAAERRMLGLNHPQVGQRLLEQWKLPAALCEVVRLHHLPHRKYMALNPLVNLVALADLLTTIDGASLYPAGTRTDLFALLKMCGMTPERIGGLFEELGRSREEAARLLSAVRGASTRTATGGAPALSASEGSAVFAVQASDELRRAWYECVLRHLGQTVVPLDEVGSAGGLTDGLSDTSIRLLADLHGASPDARRAVAGLVSRRGVSLVLANSTLPAGAPWQEAARLPVVPTRRDIAELLSCRPMKPVC